MRARRKQARVKTVNALPAGGICTTHKPDSLPPGRLETAENVRLLVAPDGRGGFILQALTRPGTTRLTNTPLPGAETVRQVLPLAGHTYLASDEHLYRLDANADPVIIGAVDRAPQLVAYRGLAVVLDGGYAKYIDPAAGHAYGVLYDVAGYCLSWIAGDDDGAWALHAGGNTRAGCQTQLADWGPGTIPLMKVKARLSKTGSPTGNAQAKVFDTAGNQLAASAALDVSTLGSSATTVELEIASPHQAAAGETVRVVIEYTGGDAANRVNLHHHNVSAGGVGVTYNGAWSGVDTAKEPLLACGAGLPPMAAWGVVQHSRLHLGGGEWADAEDAAKYHYCAAMDPFNWGSREYQGGDAGWIGVQRADGAPINGMVRFFDAVVVSKGGEEQDRSIHLITGSTPGKDGDLACRPVFNQEGAVSGRALAPAGNNVFYLDEHGLWGVEGVEGFGDARKFNRGRDVVNLIQDHAGDGAVACFDRTLDLYLLQLVGMDDTLVYHPSAGQWVTWSFTFGAPACLAHFDTVTYLGAGGHLYRLDDAVVGYDGAYGSIQGTEFYSLLWGPAMDFGAQELDKHVKGLTWNIGARFGAAGSIMFRRDKAKVKDPALTLDINVPMDDDVTWRELDSLTWQDWTYPFAGDGHRLNVHPINFNAQLVQVGLRLDPGGAPAYLGPIKLKYAILGES